MAIDDCQVQADNCFFLFLKKKKELQINNKAVLFFYFFIFIGKKEKKSKKGGVHLWNGRTTPSVHFRHSKERECKFCSPGTFPAHEVMGQINKYQNSGTHYARDVYGQDFSLPRLTRPTSRNPRKLSTITIFSTAISKYSIRRSVTLRRLPPYRKCPVLDFEVADLKGCR